MGHIQIQMYQCTFSGECSLRGQKLSSEHKSTRWKVTQHPGLSQLPPHILFPSSLGVHSCHPNEHISPPAPLRWSSKWNTASTHFTLSPEELFRAGTSFTCTFGEPLNGFSWDSFICAVREAEKEVITQSDAGWVSEVQPVWQFCTLLELLYSGEGRLMLLCHWLKSLRGEHWATWVRGGRSKSSSYKVYLYTISPKSVDVFLHGRRDLANMIKMSDMSCIIQVCPVKTQGLYDWKRKSGEQREKLEGAGKLTFKTEKNATNQET